MENLNCIPQQQNKFLQFSSSIFGKKILIEEEEEKENSYIEREGEEREGELLLFQIILEKFRWEEHIVQCQP